MSLKSPLIIPQKLSASPAASLKVHALADIYSVEVTVKIVTLFFFFFFLSLCKRESLRTESSGETASLWGLKLPEASPATEALAAPSQPSFCSGLLTAAL